MMAVRCPRGEALAAAIRLSPLDRKAVAIVEPEQRPHIRSQIEPCRSILAAQDDRLTAVQIVQRRRCVPHKHGEAFNGFRAGRVAPVPDAGKTHAILVAWPDAPFGPIPRLLVAGELVPAIDGDQAAPSREGRLVCARSPRLPTER
jgi:hypothetical protein